MAVQSIVAKIKETLVTKKLATADELEKVLKSGKSKQGAFVEVLYHLTGVEEDKILEVLSAELDLVPVRLSRLKISKEISNLIPKRIIETYAVFPISRTGDVLSVAMADPLNIVALDDLKHETGLVVIPLLAGRKDILETAEAYLSGDASEILKDVVKDIEASSDLVLVESQEMAASRDTSELVKLTMDEPVVKLTNSLLIEGVRRRSSDIFVEPQEKSLVVRYRVDGLLQDGPHPPKSMHAGIISRIKIMSNLDIAEHRLPQDGRLKLKIQNHTVDFRVSSVPTYYGEKICIRILDPAQAKLDINKLGFDPHNLGRLVKAAARPHGMMLVCGPTGSGKTTTLYSVLNYLNKIEKNIVTIEDPVEFHVEGINQVNTRSEVGLTFASALRSILRQDPDIILVGEIRDGETADIAVKAALTGHLVLSTLHTNTAIGSFTRLVNMGIEPFLITSSVVLVGSQRLVRKLCNKCKEAYKPGGEAKRALGLEEGFKGELFRRKGCEDCRQTGYAGRACVIETVLLTPALKELVLKRASEEEIRQAAEKEGMMSLRSNAVMKAVEGITTAEEVARVTAQD